MREKDITKEVIRLSKEIAEHWRMEIYEGCWFVSGLDGQPILYKDILYDPDYKKPDIPIPSISDCLEKIRELGYCMRLEDQPDFYEFGIWDDVEYAPIATGADQNLHQCILSALLEVVK